MSILQFLTSPALLILLIKEFFFNRRTRNKYQAQDEIDRARQTADRERHKESMKEVRKALIQLHDKIELVPVIKDAQILVVEILRQIDKGQDRIDSALRSIDKKI